jgi:hypothetical protein
MRCGSLCNAASKRSIGSRKGSKLNRNVWWWDRRDVLDTCIIAHANDLLRGGMRPNPRIVRADRHDREIEGPAVV